MVLWRENMAISAAEKQRKSNSTEQSLQTLMDEVASEDEKPKHFTL